MCQHRSVPYCTYDIKCTRILQISNVTGKAAKHYAIPAIGFDSKYMTSNYSRPVQPERQPPNTIQIEPPKEKAPASMNDQQSTPPVREGKVNSPTPTESALVYGILHIISVVLVK